MTPRTGRIGSGTGFEVLGSDAVEVGAQTLQVDARCPLEERDGGIGTNKAVAA